MELLGRQVSSGILLSSTHWARSPDLIALPSLGPVNKTIGSPRQIQMTLRAVF